MTTEAAAAQYLSDYMREINGRKVAIYNPNNIPVEKLPVVYGFNNGGDASWGYTGVLLAEDGTYLGGHICSHEGYMPGDLGIIEGTRPDRHETFREHYPDGYRMEFIGLDAMRSGVPEGLKLAYERNQRIREEAGE